MVQAIQAFFEKHIRRGPETAAHGHDPLHIATAALLIEMMRMDGAVTEDERQRVVRALETKFGLPPEEIIELLKLAEEEAREATDYFRFTSLIKNHFNAAARERLVELLWVVAYADGEVHRHEEHLVRKIADLLHVSHKSFIAAKLQARKRE
ncbi:MAG TPA: TerB family tellurite resistance protein [Burkholderiales bacterium]|jgi:uncharacterized tellurite resistance protein B-like protein